jgi:hypothetical protein
MSEPEATRWENETLRPPRDETRRKAVENPRSELNRLGAESWEFVEAIGCEGVEPSAWFSSDCPNE